MHIRSIDIADLPAVHVMQTELDAFRASQWTESEPFHRKKEVRVTECLTEADCTSGMIFVAEVDGVLAGYISGSIFERKGYHQEMMGCIDELLVLPIYRGKGIATQLLHQLEQVFVEKGCDHMFTKTDGENMSSQKTYTSFGMLPVTVEFWKTIE
jgi:GNAT superfamily N-acetyltransferase